MNEKRPRPGEAGTGAYQAGIESRCRQHCEQCTTTPGGLQEKILMLLRVGEANALTLRDLTNVTEADGRRVREAIRRLRLDGVPVVSGDAGYWISGSPGETRRFVRQMRSRAREILRVARAVSP